MQRKPVALVAAHAERGLRSRPPPSPFHDPLRLVGDPHVSRQTFVPAQDRMCICTHTHTADTHTWRAHTHCTHTHTSSPHHAHEASPCGVRVPGCTSVCGDRASCVAPQAATHVRSRELNFSKLSPMRPKVKNIHAPSERSRPSPPRCRRSVGNLVGLAYGIYSGFHAKTNLLSP